MQTFAFIFYICQSMYIFRGQNYMAKRQTTIQDIALALNTTASTVSRALNNHPKISEATKKLVWETAKKLNYQPNVLASSLRRGKANTIGMIVPRINRHFFSNVITGVESVLNPAGYCLLICQSDEKLEKEKENIKTFISSRVDGVLISLSVETKSVSHLEKLIERRIPLVLFDRISDQIDVHKVENDDVSGSYDLTIHLLEQGYKTFMWLGGPRTSNIYRNRYEGYRKALVEHGIDPEKMEIFEGKPTLDVALNFMNEYLKNNRLPDMIFSASDYMAMGAMQAIEEHGLKIPQDVAISGYSNEPFAALISPKLTTVEQFSEEMGRAAAKLLLDEIDSTNEVFVPRKITLKPKLIIRESSIKKR